MYCRPGAISQAICSRRRPLMAGQGYLLLQPSSFLVGFSWLPLPHTIQAPTPSNTSAAGRPNSSIRRRVIIASPKARKAACILLATSPPTIQNTTGSLSLIRTHPGGPDTSRADPRSRSYAQMPCPDAAVGVPDRARIQTLRDALVESQTPRPLAHPRIAAL